MEKDLRKLVHDLRSCHGIICCALEVLERRSAKWNQDEFQEMIARSLARSQSIITDLSSYIWQKNAFDSSNDLLIELTSLLHSLQTIKRNIIPHQIQEQLDSLITALLSLSSRGK